LEKNMQESANHLDQVKARETELELELNRAKGEYADLEHKYAMALAENRVLVGQAKARGSEGNKSDTNDKTKNKGEVDMVKRKIESLERSIEEKDALLKQQQRDHDAEVRAIQRVLADVTTDKLKLEERLNQQEVARTTPDCGGEQKTSGSDFAEGGFSAKELDEVKSHLKALEQQKQQTILEAGKKEEQLRALERDLSSTKAEVDCILAEKTKLSNEMNAAKTEAQTLVSEIETLKAKIGMLESDLSAQTRRAQELQTEVENLTKARDDAVNRAADLSKEAQSGVNLEPPKPEVEHPKPEECSHEENEEQEERDIADSPGSQDEVERLKRNLSETAASLENAKKIIASLENANGSLAVDLRSKLKAKEEELSVVQKESEERKRRLDSLATELRDLQRNQGDTEEADRRTKAQLVKQTALVKHLETSLSDLQSAVVVHESSVASETGVLDKASIEEISEILGDTLHAIKDTLESSKELLGDSDAMSCLDSDAEVSSGVGRHGSAIVRSDREAAAQELRFQLDQKKIAVKRLEEALKKQNEEMKKLRSQYDGRERGQGGVEEQLRAEIQSLRKQCSTNMEVLAKKERELSVLRSSLKVDEYDAGYISDDASDDEDGGEGETTMPSPSNLDSYGPAEAEALATILSQTNGGIDASGRSRETETLKKELLKALSEKEVASKELQAERESLANAKMIISSLEKANKGMMEDLRSRLQDSNTAIASLLDKSMEHEKRSEKLRQELEKLREEKLEEQKNHEAEVLRLKEELSLKNEAIAVDNDSNAKLGVEEKKEEDLTAESS